MGAGLYALQGVELALGGTGPITRETIVKATIIQSLAAKLSQSRIIIRINACHLTSFSL